MIGPLIIPVMSVHTAILKSGTLSVPRTEGDGCYDTSSLDCYFDSG